MRNYALYMQGMYSIPCVSGAKCLEHLILGERGCVWVHTWFGQSARVFETRTVQRIRSHESRLACHQSVSQSVRQAGNLGGKTGLHTAPSKHQHPTVECWPKLQLQTIAASLRPKAISTCWPIKNVIRQQPTTTMARRPDCLSALVRASTVQAPLSVNEYLIQPVSGTLSF